MERIAQRIKAIRKLKGLSQKELADMAGISVTTLNRIENKADCSISTIKKIEAALNVTLF